MSNRLVITPIVQTVEIAGVEQRLQLVNEQIGLVSIAIQGPEGAQGPQGIQGPIGPQGETGPEAVVESLSDIIDVTIVGPKDGDKVEYDGLANLWRNRREDKNPVYTYAAGVLTRVDYASGNYKTFSYSGGRLSQLQYVLAGRTMTKVFSYNLDGTLASISQTEVYN